MSFLKLLGLGLIGREKKRKAKAVSESPKETVQTPSSVEEERPPLLPEELAWPEVPGMEAFPRILGGLSEEQREAVTTRHSHALVYAGPGAGKTLVLVRRTAWMVEALNVPPGDIALITFTRKAAGEMRSRLDAQLGEKAAAIFVGTFHSYALHLVQSAGLEIGELLGEDDILKRFGEAMASLLGRKPEAHEVARMLGSVQRKLGFGQKLSPEEEEVYRRYQENKRQDGKADFEDLLQLPILHQGALLRARPHLLVDEYQDSNWAQLRLIKATAKTLFAVGDPKQSIYAWRGADPSLIQRFTEHFPGAKVYTLTLNHRSAQKVVEVADAFIRLLPGTEGIPKGQRPVRAEVGSVSFVPSKSPQEDIEATVKAVQSLAERFPLTSIAILYRSRKPKGFPLEKRLSEALFAAGVPQGQPDPLPELTEYRIFFSLLELVLFPGNREAARRLLEVRVLPSEIRQGLKREGRIPESAYHPRAQAIIQLYRALKGVVEDIGDMPTILGSPYFREAITVSQDRLAVALSVAQSIGELFVETLERGGGNLLDFFDTLWERAGGVYPVGVAVLTAHAAKGLEWPAVVVVGVRDGFFPASGPLNEEGFLFYVAMTRAREELVLVGDPHSRFGRMVHL